MLQHRRAWWLWAVCGLAAMAVITGCTESHGVDETETRIGGDGVSDEVVFDVPPGARSITVIVDGDHEAVFALRSLVLSDGVERVGLDPAFDLRDRIALAIAHGPERQIPMLGTFTFQYPMVATQPLPSGRATLRVASDRPDGMVSVRIMMPEGEARTLHVSLVSMSPDVLVADEEPPFVDVLRSTLAPAGITLVVDERLDLPGAAPPLLVYPPTLDDPAGLLVALAHRALSTDALPIILVSLGETNGFARGLPCPRDRTSTYHGVFVDPVTRWPGDPARNIARVAAHEIVHALGLPHTVDFEMGGARFDDPFDDTVAFDTTLMGSVLEGAPLPEASFLLTPQQQWAMRRSALLD